MCGRPAAQQGKQADLLLNGGDTMLDGEILNRLADPLLHILRNAIDHGIESPEERELLGKPATGSVTLSFLRQGQGLIVRCVDDGRGLDYAAIRAKAIERGLITAGQTLSQPELARLIMLPGFSTRDSVSEISGRGVGLDVVRERVLSMKGSVDISSAGSGRGMMIELRLQASLTALHVLLVEAAGSGIRVAQLRHRTCNGPRRCRSGACRRPATSQTWQCGVSDPHAGRSGRGLRIAR